MDKDYTTRLRNTAKYHLGGVLGNALKEAADIIDKLQEKIGELESKLLEKSDDR